MSESPMRIITLTNLRFKSNKDRFLAAQDKEVCYPICRGPRSELEECNRIFTTCGGDTFQHFGHLNPYPANVDNMASSYQC